MIINTTNTRKPITCEFVANFKDDRAIFVSYTHSVIYETGEKIMFAGYGPFRNLLDATDARKNTAWREHIAPQQSVILRVHGRFEFAHEAANDVSRLVREHKPFCNMHGVRNSKGGPIRCVTEDKSFENATECAKFYAISNSTLSNHLNKRPGYVTIRGLTFERI